MPQLQPVVPVIINLPDMCYIALSKMGQNEENQQSVTKIYGCVQDTWS